MSDRSTYIEELKSRISEWDGEMDKIKARALDATADARTTLDRVLDDLKEQRSAASAKLEEAEDSADDAWDDLKDGFETAWGKVSEAFKSARDRIV